MHIPRTGGMGIRSIMDKNYNSVGRPWWGEHEGEILSQEQREHTAWYGHFKFGLHEQLPRDTQYITLLRDPAERIASWFNHVGHKDYESPEAYLAKNDNPMVRYLSGSGFGTYPCSYVHLSAALGNLSKFAVVGFTDKYEKFCEELETKLGWKITSIPHINKSTKHKANRDRLRDNVNLTLDCLLCARVRYLLENQ